MGATQTHRRSLRPYASAAPAPPPPLREVVFDDSDQDFFVYEQSGPGPLSGWFHAVNTDWPGGSRERTVSGVSFVQPNQRLSVTTRRFYTTGTIEEGLVLNLVNENSGPLQVWVDGQLVATLDVCGYYSNLLDYTYDLRRKSRDGSGGLNYGNGFQEFEETTLFPNGWHTVRLVKITNSGEGDTSSGDKATYFDGGSVFTRDATWK